VTRFPRSVVSTRTRATMSLTLPFLSFSGIKLVPVSAGSHGRVASTSAPAVASRYTIKASTSEDEPFEIALKVEGMMCDGCATSVTEALLAATSAVKDVRVDLDTKKVSVFVTCETMMDGLGMMPTLVDAVVNAGFKAEPDF